MSEWVSVKDRLPSKTGNYLVSRYYNFFICDISHYTHPNDFKKCGFAGNYDNRITHWMPLPEPPEIK